MARILVLGGGFAGLWSAVGAARALGEFQIGRDEVEVTLVNRDAWHAIRVRNYEPDLREIRVALDDVLEPIGVERVTGEVVDIDFANREVSCSIEGARRSLAYDRLIFALGSRLVRPDIPGLAQHTFDVDTYEGAVRLNTHIDALPGQPPSPGQYAALVVGAGLTGIEAATEMVEKLRSALARAGRFDKRSGAGDPRRPTAKDRLRHGRGRLPGDRGGGRLSRDSDPNRRFGRRHRRSRSHPVDRRSDRGRNRRLVRRDARQSADRVVPGGTRPVRPVAGRPILKVEGCRMCLPQVTPRAPIDDHLSVMSCQHARPMGRFAGHNAVCDLLGRPMLPLRIDWYMTCLDLGAWGAVYTEGWDRRVVATGQAAKRTKQIINCQRIYPPRSRDRRQILDAAAPIVQAPPLQRREDRTLTDR